MKNLRTYIAKCMESGQDPACFSEESEILGYLYTELIPAMVQAAKEGRNSVTKKAMGKPGKILEELRRCFWQSFYVDIVPSAVGDELFVVVSW